MTRNEKFNRRMRRIERMSLRSDDGAAVERIIAMLDGTAAQELARQAQRQTARQLIQLITGVRLMLNGYEYLVKTFDLICEHGRFRDESIEVLAGRPARRNRRRLKAAERLYERHRNALFDMFDVD